MNLRLAARRLAAADKCPSCGTDKGWLGLNNYYCPTKGCSNFHQRTHDEVEEAAKAASGKNVTVLTEPAINWIQGDCEACSHAPPGHFEHCYKHRANQLGEVPGDEECNAWGQCSQPHVTCDGCGNRWHDLSHKGKKCPWYNDCGGVVR